MSVTALKQNKVLNGQEVREHFKDQVIEQLECAKVKLLGGEYCLLLIAIVGHCSKIVAEYFKVEV